MLVSTTTNLAVGGAALAGFLLLVVLGALLRQARATRHELAVELAATRDDVERLFQHVDDLEKALRRLRHAARDAGADDAAYVITDAGDVQLREPDPALVSTGLDQQRAVPDQLVLSATVGEPLVKVAAFGHGVRRALTAESRNRIRFAMRQEVRRSRRQRRRDMKAAYRAMQMQGEAS